MGLHLPSERVGGRALGEPKCNFCETFVVWVGNQLTQNKTRIQVISHLSDVRERGMSTSSPILSVLHFSSSAVQQFSGFEER